MFGPDRFSTKVPMHRGLNSSNLLDMVHCVTAK